MTADQAPGPLSDGYAAIRWSVGELRSLAAKPGAALGAGDDSRAFLWDRATAGSADLCERCLADYGQLASQYVRLQIATATAAIRWAVPKETARASSRASATLATGILPVSLNGVATIPPATPAMVREGDRDIPGRSSVTVSDRPPVLAPLGGRVGQAGAGQLQGSPPASFGREDGRAGPAAGGPGFADGDRLVQRSLEADRVAGQPMPAQRLVFGHHDRGQSKDRVAPSGERVSGLLGSDVKAVGKCLMFRCRLRHISSRSSQALPVTGPLTSSRQRTVSIIGLVAVFHAVAVRVRNFTAPAPIPRTAGTPEI